MVSGAWSGHRRFAYDLVRFAKPQTIVELGTFYGTSFFSFCQAVKDGALPTRCYAVDSWKGDFHTGAYGENIFQDVSAVTAREFPSIGTLLRGEFDQALDSFADGSIDLLHIDGYHTYEAVLHDFQSWHPKLAPHGILLFHDIVVRLTDFGVYELWERLGTLPHMEFPHSNGLGVLFSKGVPESFRPVLEHKEEIVNHYASRYAL
ncbi:class I SAM-dependent methyltransferase [Paenibacillus sp. RC67]|uniref:class I SAM-dependent methyltransferase n=1 Tax=Paenibacillus sp. RC67 TaxID=3039392 RepID=UPI0024AE1BF3|nr:class I SAM-dependent methyltransferase [Paenibacillus sp. RC67]